MQKSHAKEHPDLEGIITQRIEQTDQVQIKKIEESVVVYELPKFYGSFEIFFFCGSVILINLLPTRLFRIVLYRYNLLTSEFL